MGTMASQITSLTIVYSIVCLGADQRKHQSSASLAFVLGIHRWPVNFPHKGPVTRKMFPFDDVIMIFQKHRGRVWFAWLVFERVRYNSWYDDVIKRKHFPRYWPFVRGIHRSPVNSPHKGQWRGALISALVGAWINGWVNNHEAGDMRRYSVDCDVTVMEICHQLCWMTRRHPGNVRLQLECSCYKLGKHAFIGTGVFTRISTQQMSVWWN